MPTHKEFLSSISESLEGIHHSMDELVALNKAQVPDYLVGSEFYNSLSADDEEEFSIPRKFLKPNVSVASGAELVHLFHTMKFWGMTKLPDEVLELAVFKSRGIPDHEAGPIRDVLTEFDPEFKLSQLFETLPVCAVKKQRLDTAVQCGREDVLEHVVRVDDQVNCVVIKAAAEYGFFQLLQRVANEFVPVFGKSPYDHVSTATVASRGHSECLQYLLENGCKKNRHTCRAAAANGHLACLKIAREHECAWSQGVMDDAAKNGHLDCLKYAMEYSNLGRAVEAACAAAEHNNVACLQYILDQGISPARRICSAACLGNSLACLQLLRARGAPWGAPCANTAASFGSLSCLQFLLDKGCEVDGSSTAVAAAIGHDQCLNLLLARGCAVQSASVVAAAEKGHSECVKLLKKYGVPLDEKHLCRAFGDKSFDSEYWALVTVDNKEAEMYVRTLFEAGYDIPGSILNLSVSNGFVAAVEYLCANECGQLTASLTALAFSSRIKCPRSAAILKVLHRYGCPWDKDTCTRAAVVCDLESLQFAHENGCPWDVSTTAALIRVGGNECMQYALAHDCPLSKNACELAAQRGLDNILQLLHERGCALTLQTCLSAVRNRRPGCLSYAVQHGAPVDASICAIAALAFVTFREPNISACNSVDTFTMLQCAHELGCPWDERTCAAAAATSAGFKCLKYAHENGCPWDESTPTAAISCKGLASLKYAWEHGCPFPVDACDIAASRGHVDILQWLHEHDSTLRLETCIAAAANKYTNCLTYAVTHGAPVDTSVCASAASDVSSDPEPRYYNAYNQVTPDQMLECAHKLGCPWDASTATAAVQSDCIAALMYALENGCPCDVSTSLAAAENGNLRALKLLHEHGCPWDERVSQAAAASDNAPCLRYCVENGCPISKDVMKKYNRSL